MEMSTLTHSRLGETIGRPTSVPLRDDDWDLYVQDRKLLQPPAGVTPPISPTGVGSRIAISPAVADALNQRKRRESALGAGEATTDSSEDVPLAKIMPHHRHRSSSGGNMVNAAAPVNILPPRKPIVAPTPQRPAATRTRTFEELNDRHREKMRDLQAPLTTAAREDADLEVAKQRWEKAKALEKEAVTRRQAEKAALLERRKRSEDDAERGGRRSLTLNDPAAAGRHSRSLSADKLGGSTSKRLSTMKVEDWVKYQQAEVEGPKTGGSGSKRDSRGFRDNAPVPFPGGRKSRGEPPS